MVCDHRLTCWVLFDLDIIPSIWVSLNINFSFLSSSTCDLDSVLLLLLFHKNDSESPQSR